MGTAFAYLSPARPRIFAHRGLANAPGIVENTLAAFEAAVTAGANYIETDLQVTKDGVAVLFHDDDLVRIAGLRKKVSQLTLQQLQSIDLGFGARIPTLEEALVALPAVRFNLDFKVAGVIKPATEVLNRLAAADRILVASFSDRRRRAALRRLTSRVATSAGASVLLGLYLSAKFGFNWALNLLARSVQALQIPVNAGLLRFDSPWFIAAMKSARVEVHYWTINDFDEMRRLIALGADGIVTDRADFAVNTLRT